MGDEGKSFLDYAIDIDIGKFGGAGAGKIQKIVYDFAGPKRLLHDLIDDVVPRIIFRHLLGEHLNVVGDDGERRIDFVGHASGEKAERGELFGLAHLLFHALALGDIVEQQKAADALPGFAHQRSNGNIQRQIFTLVMQALLVDAGDLLFVAARGDFRSKFFGEERAELMAYGILALHAKELLHTRVPGLDHAAEIDGQHTDV